jgi:outer membrane cobalamin receptor
VQAVRLFLLCVSLVLCLPARGRAQDAGPSAQDPGDGGWTDAGSTNDAAVPPEDCGLDAVGGPDLLSADEVIHNPPVTNDVVVTARRPLSKDRTQDTTSIQGERIRDSSRTTVFDVLSQESADVYVPGHGVGLHGVSNGATGGIRIRGLGGSPNSQILVVEDGAPDYQGIFGHPIPDAYVPHLIDEVLVIKGGDSTLYGSNAMGGVVVIRSRWRDREGYEAQNDAGYGSYSTLRESVSALGRVGAWDAAAAFTDMKTEGHREGAGGSDMVGSAALCYRFTPSLRLTLRNKVVHVQGNDPGPVTNPSVDHWFDVWRDNASMRVAYAPGNLRLSLTPYLNVGVHRLYDGFYSRDVVGGAIGEMDLRLHRMASLLLGLAGDGVDGMVENRVTGEKPEVRGLASVSFYNQVTLRPVAPLNIVLGTRGFYSSKYGFVALYKAGARWDVGRGFFLHSRVSRNFRQPTIRELYLPYPTANPDLKPEYSVNADAGGSYVSEHFEFSCTWYRTEARNLIKYFGVWPTAEVVNIDHIVIPGVEGRVAVKRLGPVSASVSADWQDVGRYSRQNPDAKINFTIEATQDFGPHFLAGSLTGEWVHGLYMADYDRQPIPNVFVMDLAIRYRYAKSTRGVQAHTLEPYLLLRNFLDRQYAYVAGYTMPGFNVLVGLKVGI